jgi:thiol-disulfide isomerase/thioredoxin
MGNAVMIVVLLLLGLVVGMQLLVRSRARAMRGKDVPALPGDLGRQLTGAPRALLYFFSPSCGACKALTPSFAALSRSNPSVHLVDVAQSLGVARSFHVMGTPSVIELADGKIVGYHVGAVPAEVLARFA